MDIWKDAHQMILDRLSDEKRIWRPEEIQLVTEPPIRTDAGETASDYLPEVEGIVSHKPKFSKDVMKSMLLEKWGVVCWACGFEPPNKDARFFDLDHNNPKAAGGSHELDNRSILCRPCNGAKSDKMTLTELRRKNKSNGIWYGAIAIDKTDPVAGGGRLGADADAQEGLAMYKPPVMRLPDGEKLPLTHPEQLVHWPPGKLPGGKLPEPIPGCDCAWCAFRRSDEWPGKRG